MARHANTLYMIYFECDYGEGCAPAILQALEQTNLEQTVGYGLDPYSLKAQQLIADLCGLNSDEHKESGTLQENLWRERETAGAVHFLVGGTQTNTVVINYLLRPHQGVIAADCSHINVHETGAIEHFGHKVLVLPTQDGRLTAAQVQDALLQHLYDPNIEHTIQPGMVYLSFPTETGMIYSKSELQAISSVCRQYRVPLYIDGARLGYGLRSPKADITLRELAALTDIFYIGGTKQGALFGEALVICNPAYRKDFRYFIKQGGGMLAKGRLLGLQFLTLFTDNLYWQLSDHAVSQALRIRQALADKGYPLYMDSYTNQQFTVLTNEQMERLQQRFVLSVVERTDSGHTVVRICTDWATDPEIVTQLINAL